MRPLNLILTGHMRCWNQTYINTFQNIISKFQTQVFISTWDTEGYWTSPEADPEGKGINTQSPKINKAALVKTYCGNWDSDVHVYNYGSYEPMFKSIAEIFQPYCQEIRPVNTISQFWIAKQGFEDFGNAHYKNKDALTIRMRPDLILDPSITELIENADLDKIYTLYHRNHTGQGTGDMFLMGSLRKLDNLHYYMSSVYTLTQLTLKYNRFCPHIFIKDLCGDQHVELNVPKTLLHTPNGQYKDWTKQ